MGKICTGRKTYLESWVITVMAKLFGYILFVLMYSGGNLCCNSQVPQTQREQERLILISKIVLPGVKGRIDHMTYDPVNHLAFMAALGNNTVEVVNVSTNHVEHTITGLHEPQGIVYIPSSKKLVVANGDDGECIFFDGKTYNQLGVVHLKSDA